MIGAVGNVDLEEELFSVPPSTFFRGRNRLLGSQVLVRRLTIDPVHPAEARAAFFRAQRHAASLAHPAIFRPVDILDEHGFLWTVHEFHANRPSDVLVQKRGPAPMADAARVASHIADALAYMHRRGFVHGKVSPHDIVVGMDGRALLLSLTKSAELAAGIWPLPPDVLGLSPFSTPEELAGARPTAASDTYSLAATVFYWLTGACPRGGVGDEEALARARAGAPAADLKEVAPNVPAPVAEAIRAALHADPARRRGSCAALASLFDETYRRLIAEVPSGFESGVRLVLLGEERGLQILGRHGAGAFGVVFRAREDARHSHVAVKALKPQHREDPEARQRFLREAESVRGIVHPNVIHVRGVGEQGGTPFVVMDFIEGSDLGTILLKEGALPAGRAAELAAGIARGLAAIHDHGVVHRDMKPHNILVNPAGIPVVTDFGVARDRTASRLTLTGHLVGTPAYMSPEQVEGEPATPLSDLYALGSVLFEMLTGLTPFPGRDTISTMRAIRENPPPDLPPTVPPDLRDVVVRLLAKSPEDRYPDATAVAEVLEGIAARLHSGGAGGAEVDRMDLRHGS